MGLEKKKYNERLIAVEEEFPQHVIDENRADEIRMLRKEQAQREMYDDPYLNWSGLR